MTTPIKPREWTAYIIKETGELGIGEIPKHTVVIPTTVVEASAFDKAVAALKEIAEYKWCPACKNENSRMTAIEALRELGVEI